MAAIFWFVKKRYSYFEDRGIPFSKPSLLLGNMSGMSTKIHFVDITRNIYEECKGKDVVAGLFTSISPSLIATDLELAKAILIKDFNKFSDRGMYVNEEVDPLTAHLFSLEGEKWRFLRNKLSPTFTSGKIKMMFDTIADKGNNLVNAIDKASMSGPVEVKGIANKFTADVISSCAFGIEADTLDGKHPEMSEIFKQLTDETSGWRLLKVFFLFTFPKIAKFLSLREFSEKIEDFFMNIVGSTMTYREENNIDRKDFMNMLIQLKNKGSIDGEISTDNRRLTFNECVAQAFVFVSSYKKQNLLHI